MKFGKNIAGSGLLILLSMSLLLSLLCATGCTIHTNGMTIPSPNWLEQRVQYYPAGPQFPHSNERALIEAAEEERGYTENLESNRF
ncbi:MAG: hypothetical protein ACRC10_11920 [Thermoguttaceae bacterium]